MDVKNPEQRPFWAIWNPDGNLPMQRLFDKAYAMREAERLARKQQGQTFVVMQAVASRCVEGMRRVDFAGAGELPAAPGCKGAAHAP